MNNDPYLILKVEKNCDIETVKKQFKKLAVIYHPDKLKHNLIKEKLDEKNSIDFVTLIWAYEEILKNIQNQKNNTCISQTYENALSIHRKDLEYIKEENTFIYFCRCGDFFIFNENLCYEYYVIYVCQSCSSSIYLIP
ncbi:DnaJ protein, putative [Plasmodium sp. gorilla clade G3]|nr:DnaJ protein, putative [Plasmodium sp. gorilla clade G3]